MKKLLKTVIRGSKKLKLAHAWPMTFYMLSYLIGFNIVENVPRSHYLQVTLVADRFIPFVEIFVIPYLSWFLYIAFGLVYTYYADRRAYDRLCTYLMIGMTVFIVISAILPNRQPLRLVQMPRDNVFTRMIVKLWKTDTPTNVFPSIHVFNTAAVETMLFTMETKLAKNPVFRVFTVIWSVSIILSTVFIKQHSLFDMLTALVLIAICWFQVFVKKRVFTFPKWDVFAARLEESV